MFVLCILFVIGVTEIFLRICVEIEIGQQLFPFTDYHPFSLLPPKLPPTHKDVNSYRIIRTEPSQGLFFRPIHIQPFLPFTCSFCSVSLNNDTINLPLKSEL